MNNCTVVDNGADIYGDLLSLRIEEGGDYAITNSILRNGDNSINDGVDITYSNVEGGYEGEGNIDSDPIFVSGSWGDYYLSQRETGHDQTSPCVNAGSDTSENLCMNFTTTRTDGVFDTDRIDMGYHYPPHVQFFLGIEPKKVSFKEGDQITVTTGLLTAPYGDGSIIDLYFVLVDPEGSFYSYPAWNRGLQPFAVDFPIPPYLSMKDIKLLDTNIPSDKPPIEMLGTYTFAIFATKTDTIEFISNIGSLGFRVE